MYEGKKQYLDKKARRTESQDTFLENKEQEISFNKDNIIQNINSKNGLKISEKEININNIINEEIQNSINKSQNKIKNSDLSFNRKKTLSSMGHYDYNVEESQKYEGRLVQNYNINNDIKYHIPTNREFITEKSSSSNKLLENVEKIESQ